MLYILQLMFVLLWFIYIVKKQNYPLRTVITAYFFFLAVIDVVEGIYTYYFQFYTFSTHLINNPVKDNQLGLILCDGYLLPISGIILCHYATRVKKLWGLSLLFALLNGILERIYIALGYLHYIKWNTWISVAIYFFTAMLFGSLAPRLIKNKPPLPYPVSIAASTYSLTIYIGEYISGGLIGLFEWRPLITGHPG